MNRYTIPSILTGIVLIAGIFAFMPVYEAATVHTTIQNTMIRGTGTFDGPDWDAAGGTDELNLECTAATLVHEISLNPGGLGATDDDIDMLIDVDGTGTATFPAQRLLDIYDGSAPQLEDNILATEGFSQGIALGAGGMIIFDLVQETEAGTDQVDAIATYTSQGTCTWRLE